MNYIKHILSGALFLAGTLFALSSCSDEESTRHDDSRAVVFTTSVGQSAPDSTEPGRAGSAPTTRLAGDTWQEGDRVGVFMLKEGETLPESAAFNKYIAQGGTSSALSPDGKDNTLEYPEDGSNVSFIAYYPYTTQRMDNIAIYSAFQDQTTANKMAASDVVYSNSGDAYNKETKTATLHFDHKFSKLVLNVKTSTGDEAVDLSKLSVLVENVPSSGAIDLTDGTLPDTENATNVNPYVSEKSATAFTAQAIIAPHKGAANAYADRKVTFTLTTEDGEKTATVAMDADLDFKSGKVYTLNYTLTPKPDGIAVEPTGVTISAWTGGTWTDYNYNVEAPKAITVPVEAVDEYVYTFKTNYTGTVSIIRSTSETDAHAGAPAWLTEVEKPTASAPDANGMITYTYKFATTDNASGSRQVAYLHLNIERMDIVVKVTQNGEEISPNCYIVKPGETVELPVARANLFTKSIGEADAIDDATVFTGEVLWMDAQGLIEATNLAALETEGAGKTGIIKVTAASGKTGNALVAAIVNNKIVWSWHIWVTEYAPNPAQNNGWLDRNLGAINATPGADGSTGLYYQWGRKDPFPGLASPTSTDEPKLYSPGAIAGFNYAMKTSKIAGLSLPTLVESVQKNMAWTIENPLTFIGVSTPFDNPWMLNPSASDAYWGTVDSPKALFDPCPEGYRVPQRGNWGTEKDWKDNFTWNEIKGGYDTGSMYGGWYSTMGYRSSIGGGIRNNSGGCWSASAASIHAYELYLSSEEVKPSYSNHRCFGFSVRCIADVD